MKNTELSTIALISSEPIRQVMAGIGIRYIGMANALIKKGFKVCLYSTTKEIHAEQLAELECQYKEYLESAIESELAGYDFVVAQGRCAAQIAGMKTEVNLIIDLYDPYIIENLSYADNTENKIYRNDHSEWIKMLNRGDFFLCANNHQKLFYLGWLMALDRLKPDAYVNDKYYSNLIDVVPFGISPPSQEYENILEARDDSTCRILFGGVYDWYDPWVLLEAIKDEPNVQVIFVRNPNAATTPQKIFNEIERYCKMHSISDSQINIIDWVPYTRRYDLLRDVDMLIAPHEQGLESELSLRTRFLEALAVGCPVICTEGGRIAELVQQFDGGHVVTEKDAQQLKSAIQLIFDKKKNGGDWSDSSKRISALYSWDSVLQPLLEYCARQHDAVTNIVTRKSVRHHTIDESHVPCRFSIVLPTFNRMDTLPDVIESIKSQKKALPFEVIIINDGSTDGTREWLDASSFPFPNRIIHSDNMGPARARNTGFSESQGDIVLLLGDDMIADPFWLYYHQQEHLKARDENLILVGLAEWDERIRRTPFVKYLDETGWQFGFSQIEDPENLGFNYLYASNISLSRSLLNQNRFDESFPFPAWEDTELGLRLVQSGARLKYLPAARTSHMHRTTIKRFCNRHRKSGYAAVKLYRLHPGLEAVPVPGENDLSRVRSVFFSRVKQLMAGALDFCSIDVPGMWESVLRESYIQGFQEALQELNPNVSSPLLSFLPLTWKANSSQLQHQTGQLKGGSWQCSPDVDSPGHCIFGPYFRVDSDCQLVVSFKLTWHEEHGGNAHIASIDIYDSKGDEILQDYQLRPGMSENISLPVEAKAGQALEFRVYWHGEALLNIQSITLDWMKG